VGDRGHRKGQLRVLGSPSARHTKEPRTGGPPGGAGNPRTRFFFAKVPSYISEGTKTGLQTPRANRYHSSYCWEYWCGKFHLYTHYYTDLVATGQGAHLKKAQWDNKPRTRVTRTRTRRSKRAKTAGMMYDVLLCHTPLLLCGSRPMQHLTTDQSLVFDICFCCS
jgi:hypothetical protein